MLGNLSPWQHPVIILKDIKYEELLGIVEFIYHGEVSIDQECLAGFLQAAETLRIKGLTEDKKDKVQASQETKESSPSKSAIIHKALKKLMNGVESSASDEVSENNNEDCGNNMMEAEEEEEALSESEIPDGSLKGIDFQTMYQSFMSGGSVSEDSDGSKDMMGVNDDGGALNINFADSNSPTK